MDDFDRTDHFSSFTDLNRILFYSIYSSSLPNIDALINDCAEDSWWIASSYIPHSS